MATPFVEITLDKTYRLRFGMLATYNIEQKFGRSISDINWEKEGISGFLKAATCAIVKNSLNGLLTDINEVELAELVDEYSNQTLFIETVSKAMEAGYGKNVQVAAEKKAKK